MKARLSGPEGPWQKVFAWKPVKINKKWYWLKTVYIREKSRFVFPHQGYEYGTILDVLRTTE